MKASKWRELADDEVRQKVRELSEEIFNLRFQLSMGVAKNPSRVGEARRDHRQVIVGDGWIVIRHRDLDSALKIADAFSGELQLIAG